MTNEQQDTITILSNFIKAAEKSRNYPPNTASGFRSALKLFEPALNDEERESLPSFEDNLDKIYQVVASRNQQKYSAASLQTYYKRIKVLVRDYRQYGEDPTRMANWKRPIRSSRSTKQPTLSKKKVVVEDPLRETPQSDFSSVNRLELALRANSKAILVLPADLTDTEAALIKSLVDASVRKIESI